MRDLWQDLRFGGRALRKNPGFALVTVAVLALAIGANTAMFSVVNAFLLRPLPVREAERLVQLLTLQGRDPVSVSAIDYEAWQESAGSLDGVTLALPEWRNLTGDAEPVRVDAARVLPDFFTTLGAAPLLGRTFAPEEGRGEPARVVLLSHALWQQRFGGDEGVAGRTLLLDGQAHEVIGVMPPGLDLPFRTALWTPLSLDTLDATGRTIRNYFGVARLKRGVSAAAADEELKVIARRLEAELPATHAGWSASAVPLRQMLLDDYSGGLRRGLLALLAAVGFLLLIACANLANLLLGRALGRSHEVALRLALGASRGRLVRQLLTETALVLAAGAAAGVLLAMWATPLLVGMSPVEALALGDRLLDTRLDAGVLFFAVGVTALTGLLVGLLPALQATRSDLRRFLTERAAAGAGRPGARRVMSATVVAQVALTLTLLTAAGMMLQGFARLLRMPLGFRPEGVASLELALPEASYGAPERRAAFAEQLVGRVQALPGVSGAGISTNAPLSHNYWDARFECEGRPPASESEVLLTADRLVTPGYLEMLGVTLLRGRLLTAEDRAGAQQVVVVSESLANICWPSQDPLGKRARHRRPVLGSSWMTVVGLVKDVKEDRSAFRRDRPVWYVPYLQVPDSRPLYVLVRSDGDATNLAAQIRGAVHALDPSLPAQTVLRLEAYLGSLIRPDRFSAFLLIGFAGAGLTLASVGMFGLLSYGVSQRTREIGVRMALGATPKDILRLVVGQGMKLTTAGLALGLAGSFAAMQALARFVHEAGPVDWLAVCAACVLMAGVAVAACALPARRAARVEPLVALRYE
ncbi:MAG: ABC transporter permease [Acidobacteria bacterium]|nr:ABC transporter permease [Acidobacteriota bacterium]